MRLVILILTLTLVSCTITKSQSELVLNGDKALVIVTAQIDNNKDTKILWTQDSELSFVNTRIIDRYGFNIFDPGTYYLCEVEAQDVTYGSGTTTQTVSPRKNILSFSVKGGEVIYLGKILINTKNDDITFDVKDNIDYDLKHNIGGLKSFPELKNKLQKKVLQLTN